MARRGRPHPARAARRVAGAASAGGFAALVAVVGWAQRASEADPDPTQDSAAEESIPAERGVARLDLTATARFTTTVAPDRDDGTVPVPPPAPRSVVTTTTRPPTTTAPPPPPGTTPPTTTTTASPTTTVPPTTTAPPPTTLPPTTTIPTGPS